MNSGTGSSRSVWRQPLLHFLVAGAAIFALDAFREPVDSAGQRIVVTVGHVERLADQWQMTWGRPPGEAELQALVQNYIKEEVYYREAIKLGLDVNDAVIRQRLGRKMEFLFVPELGIEDASDAQLTEFFQNNREKYRKSPVVSFEHVYFNDATPQILTSALEQLNSGAKRTTLGDSIGLPRELEEADKATITRTFGSRFYLEIQSLMTGVWSGPVESGFGQHLVYITHKQDARNADFSEVRNEVINDWLAEQNSRLQNEAYEKLKATYEVDIDVSKE